MTDQEFESCVRQIIQNDKDGLKEIYVQYRVYIYSCMWKVVQNKENAEDLTADFFVKFWETAHKYKFGGRHRAWIATIARNMAIDFLRKHQREVLSDEVIENREGVATDYSMQTEPAVEDTVINQMFIKEALDTLSVSEREILHLKIVGGLTYREITEVLRLPVGTVTWRYQSALNKIRRCGYE